MPKEAMYYTDKKLQYPVRVENPNPLFARALQQAIGGVEGEIRVCMQYFFQAWGARAPVKYRDMLLNTATEEISHIEMLATAVALNLEGAPVSLQEEMAAASPAVNAMLGGMDMRQLLSTGLSALPSDANGRDTMHQQQWLAVLEELGPSHLPIPNSFPQSKENGEFAYNFFITTTEGVGTQASQPWTTGPAPDGKGQFSIFMAKPLGEEPKLGFGRPDTFGQKEQAADSLTGVVSKGKDILERRRS